MGDQVFLKRDIRFDHESRQKRSTVALKLVYQFEVSAKTDHRTIESYRNNQLSPLKYEFSNKWHFRLTRSSNTQSWEYLGKNSLNLVEDTP